MDKSRWPIVMPEGRNRKNGLQRRLDRRQMVARLYCQGWSQLQIAAELDCAQSIVSTDLAELREQWQTRAARDFDSKMAEELAKIDLMEQNAWQGWFRSCENARSCTIKTAEQLKRRGTGTKGEEARLEVVSKFTERSMRVQNGDPKFLQIVAVAINMRLKILLGQSYSGRPETAKLTVEWERLYERVGVGPGELELEATIAQAGQPALPPQHINGTVNGSTNGNGHSGGTNDQHD